MLFRCLALLFCLTAICAQKGGRQASASVERPSPSRIWAGRKVPQASEPIVQQVAQEPEDSDPPEEDREVVVAAIPRRPSLPPPSRPILPPPSRPQPAEADPGGHPAPEPYSFSYKVDDPETGAASSREETQDINGEIVGYYHMQDAEGRMRRVDYTAGKDGFKANIRSNEEGLNSRAPADVNIEMSASPSELRPTIYTPNNRPAASDVSLKSWGSPSIAQERFYQRLVPAPVAPLPLPAPPAQETQRIEQVLEQRAEDPPQEAQISQTYETSDPQEIVQQKNVDEEVTFESTPLRPLPPIAQPQKLIQAPTLTWSAPQRPIGQFTPSRIESYREQGVISLNSQPITQVKEDFANIIDTQPLASPKTIPSLPIAPPASYSEWRPLAPVVNARPVPSVTPQFVQFQQRVQHSVPNLAPLRPITNNIPQTYYPQQIQQLVRPPAPVQSLPQVSLPLIPYQYKPLPSPLPQQIQIEERPQFKPQTYEPLQQTYEPQQEAEDPAEESRVEPPCDCAKQAASILQPVKGLSAASEPQPVKSGRLSPAQAFLPQAFRSS